MSSAGGFQVDAFGCRIHASGSSAEAQEVLERCVFPGLPRTSGAADAADIKVRIEGEPGGFALQVNGSGIAAAEQPGILGAGVVRALDEAVLQRLDGLWAMHAGTVVWGERALLLPGMTHAGKSALVAQLLRRGATYFSDEYALIDAEGWVHPYPRPLMLRNGSPEQTPTPASEFGASTGAARARVRWAVALRYAAGGTWTVRPVPQSEGVLLLLRHTPHVWAESPRLVGVVEQAMAGAACWVGERGEVEAAAEAILALVGKAAD